jgi:hypothetical protein
LTAYVILIGGQYEEAEGNLWCTLRRRPLYRPKLELDLDAPSNSPIFNGRKATMYFANLDCVYYPNDSTADADARRFGRAAREIARSGRRS